MKEKKIASVKIFEIKACKHILCGPPALWVLEAAVDVTCEDGSEAVRYISTFDLGEACWQVQTKPFDELKDLDDVAPYIEIFWEEDKDAFASPYGEAIMELDSIFQKIANL